MNRDLKTSSVLLCLSVLTLSLTACNRSDKGEPGSTSSTSSTVPQTAPTDPTAGSSLPPAASEPSGVGKNVEPMSPAPAPATPESMPKDKSGSSGSSSTGSSAGGPSPGSTGGLDPRLSDGLYGEKGRSD
jgi:hypothetical protein